MGGVRRIAILAAIVGTLACARQAPPRNVILVLVDTLRADHLSLYGYGRETSPYLDRRARSAVVFETARAQASCTFPSVNSLLTSRYPAEFLGQPGGYIGIRADTPTLAEHLARRGFATWAVSASPIVRRTPSDLNPHGGFGRGFEVFDERCLWNDARCVSDRALELVETSDGRPFLLYLHFMEPHDPYSPPERHARRFSATYRSSSAFVNRGDSYRLMKAYYGEAPPVTWTRRDLEHLADLYDDEIAYFDEEFERLMNLLAVRIRFEETLVVLLSDHGEHLLLEHLEYQHCRAVFEESIRTPLVVWSPGERAGRRVDVPVQNLDVMPTLLDLLGVPVEGDLLKGQSLRRLLAGRGGTERPGFAAQGAWVSAFDRRFKLIVDLESSRQWLFDIRADPGERLDLQRERSEEVSRLGGELVSWVEREGGSRQDLLERAEKSEESLRALGYL